MSIVELLALFADPVALKELTMSQKMVASLVTTLLGMGITFLALIVLQVVTTLMARFVPGGRAVKKEEIDDAGTTAAEPGEELSQEMVAAISLSLAVMLQRSPDTLIIKNVRKVGETAPAWSRAGMVEQMEINA